MRTVGLTGGIAAGKSTVAKLLRARGVPVIDADQVSRDVVAPGSPALSAIVARFGPAVLQPDGALDRKALGACIIADPAARADLEAITHPAIRAAIAEQLAGFAAAGQHIDAVVGMESRGFLFGAPLAMELSAAFVPARKPGKLPYHSVGVEYDLEYGSARLEMHIDAIKPGQRVLIVDDLLATGGTAMATAQLVVAAHRPIQLARLMAREGIDEPAATRWLDAQLPLDAKIRVATAVIWNDQDPTALATETDRAWAEILASIGM